MELLRLFLNADPVLKYGAIVILIALLVRLYIVWLKNSREIFWFLIVMVALVIPIWAVFKPVLSTFNILNARTAWTGQDTSQNNASLEELEHQLESQNNLWRVIPELNSRGLEGQKILLKHLSMLVKNQNLFGNIAPFTLIPELQNKLAEQVVFELDKFIKCQQNRSPLNIIEKRDQCEKGREALINYIRILHNNHDGISTDLLEHLFKSEETTVFNSALPLSEKSTDPSVNALLLKLAKETTVSKDRFLYLNSLSKRAKGINELLSTLDPADSDLNLEIIEWLAWWDLVSDYDLSEKDKERLGQLYRTFIKQRPTIFERPTRSVIVALRGLTYLPHLSNDVELAFSVFTANGTDTCPDKFPMKDDISAFMGKPPKGNLLKEPSKNNLNLCPQLLDTYGIQCNVFGSPQEESPALHTAWQAMQPTAGTSGANAFYILNRGAYILGPILAALANNDAQSLYNTLRQISQEKKDEENIVSSLTLEKRVIWAGIAQLLMPKVNPKDLKELLELLPEEKRERAKFGILQHLTEIKDVLRTIELFKALIVIMPSSEAYQGQSLLKFKNLMTGVPIDPADLAKLAEQLSEASGEFQTTEELYSFRKLLALNPQTIDVKWDGILRHALKVADRDAIGACAAHSALRFLKDNIESRKELKTLYEEIIAGNNELLKKLLLELRP